MTAALEWTGLLKRGPAVFQQQFFNKLSSNSCGRLLGWEKLYLWKHPGILIMSEYHLSIQVVLAIW